MSVEGLITLPCLLGPRETMDRLVAEIEAHGMKSFARIDHAAGAEAAGLKLAATELLLFGNPEVGTALMQASQTTGIDLPLKALVWQDASGAVFLSYNDPVWIARRHSLGPDANATIHAMSSALAAIVTRACGSP
jgi:uncharacterized protein (DUF302 family)